VIRDRRQPLPSDAQREAAHVQRRSLMGRESWELFGAHQQPHTGTQRAREECTADARNVLVQIRHIERASRAKFLFPPPDATKLIERRSHRPTPHIDATAHKPRDGVIGTVSAIVEIDDRIDGTAIVVLDEVHEVVERAATVRKRCAIRDADHEKRSDGLRAPPHCESEYPACGQPAPLTARTASSNAQIRSMCVISTIVMKEDAVSSGQFA